MLEQLDHINIVDKGEKLFKRYDSKACALEEKFFATAYLKTFLI